MFDEMPIRDAFKEWNHNLVLNHPWLWTLRLPFLALYLAGTALLLGISAVLPLKTYYANYLNTWLWILTIIELILFVLWMRQFNQFNPEKSLERTTPFKGMLEIVIYMMVVFMFFAPTISSSYLLKTRYTQLVSFTEISRYYDLSWGSTTLYSKGMVETFSQMDYESYLALDNTPELVQVNRQIDNTIHSLYTIHHYDNPQYLLQVGLILTHLGIFMFAFRHLRKGVLGKTFITALVLMVAISFAAAITDSDFSEPLIYFRTYITDPKELVFFIFLTVLSLGIFTLALQVFSQKQYRTSTAISITLLPYVIYYWLLIIAAEYISEIGLFETFFDQLREKFSSLMVETFLMLLLGTPLAILAVFILVKAMYTRLLVLPEG